MSIQVEAKKIYDLENCFVLCREVDILNGVEKLSPRQEYATNTVKGRKADEQGTAFLSRVVRSGVNEEATHTERAIKETASLLEYLNLDSSSQDILLGNVQLRDIAKARQVLETLTPVDQQSFMPTEQTMMPYSVVDELGITNHGRYGEHILRSELFEKSAIPKELQDIILTVVRYHADTKGSQYLPLDDKALEYKTIDIIMSDLEEQRRFMSLNNEILQAVDSFDLHSKVLAGIQTQVRDSFGIDVYSGDTVASLADSWGLSPERLRDFNKMPAGLVVPDKKLIRVPMDEVPEERLEFPKDIQEMVANDSFPPMAEFMNHPRYNDLTYTLWRITHAIRNISFIPMLQRILDVKVLDKELEMHPPRYQKIMAPWFKLAEEEIGVRIAGSKSKVLAPRTAVREGK